MTSQEINNNNKFNEEGILLIDELTLKQLYNECSDLIYHGIQYCGGSDREIMEEYIGFFVICSFKTELAKKTKTGKIVKSEYSNPSCYLIQAQKPEQWFKIKYSK